MQKRNGSTFPVQIKSAQLKLPDGITSRSLIGGITGSKPADGALRESEEKYRTLVENLNDAIFTVNAKGYVIYISPAIENATGYRTEEIIGRPFSQYIHPEDRQDVLEYFRLAMSGCLERHTFRIIKKDGAVCYACINGRLARRDGQLYLTGSLKDITACEQTRQELQRERDFSKAVLDTAGMLVVVFDLDGRIISFNRACEAVSGYTFQEAQGKVIWDLLIIPEEKERILKACQDLISGRPSDGENFWITKQGDLRLIAWKNTVLLNDRNAAEYVIATGLDITGHRQTEAALMQANKIFESALSGIVVTDCSDIIQRVNPAFTEITGYTEEEMIGKNISILECDPEYHDKVVRALAGGNVYHGETWNRHRDGTIYLAGYSINAIKDDEGRNLQYATNFYDITEEEEIRRERQQLQEQKARMQKLSSLSALSAGIVHEIAQPLNSIKLLADGTLYLYEKGLFELNDVGVNLKDISAQVDQITALINQVRSFANVGRETEVVSCNLNRAVKRIMTFLGRQLSAHGITLKTELKEKLPTVFGAPNGYEEVVLNLLTNAMYALDAIDNREKEITIRTFLTGGKVVLEVSDNATGIKDEIREEIFEPLFSTKKPGEGMGLGLSIVQSLVERFNGRIEVQNKIQGGATFRVELPVACCSIKGR